MKNAELNKRQAFCLEDYVPYLLHQSHLAILELFSPALTEHGLTLPEWRVLAVLQGGELVRFRDLVAATGLEPPTLARVVSKLEEQAFLTREKSDVDKRGTFIASTSRGRAVTSRIIPRAYEVEAEVLKDLSDDEAELLRRLVRRVLVNARG